MKKTEPTSRLQQNKNKLCQRTNETHKNTLKEEILQIINENFIVMILDMVHQNVQETLKKFQDNKNREFEKVQEQTEKLQKHCINTKVIQRAQ
jgi:hypothetical protein